MATCEDAIIAGSNSADECVCNHLLVPHLSSRRRNSPVARIATACAEVVKMDYVIADLWHAAVSSRLHQQLIRASVTVIDQLSGNREYGIIGFKDGVILMQKAVASQPEATVSWLAFRRELS